MLLSVLSCESFTEVDMPQSQLTGTAVFEDVETANAAMSDIYARIREGGVSSGTLLSVTLLMGCYSDDMTFYGSNAEIEQLYSHAVVPSNSLVAYLWTSAYGQVYAANAMIEGLERSTSISAADRGRLLGEAKFIRAYLHFYLANLYGDIPYIATTDYGANAAAGKIPYRAAMERILADLSAAESLLPESYPTAERVRPNKAAATAMLARAYLYAENWEMAAQHAASVIGNPSYAWQPDLSLAFLKDSRSIIWALHAGTAGTNTKDARTFSFTSGPPTKPALSEQLRNSFEAGDLRRSLWIKEVAGGTRSWYLPYKYKKTTNTGTSQEYTILFRLEEQYLIRAEARAHLGDIAGARADLNKSRNRAGLPDTPASDAAGLVAAVLQERRSEFFTEQGHRWFDLKRTGTAGQALGSLKPGWKATDAVLPLPESELLLNGNLLPQNAGY